MRPFLDWLDGLGRRCYLCGDACAAELCVPCRTDLPAADPCCPRCALPTPAPLTCGACLRRPPPYARCIAALPYRWPADAMLNRFKEHGDFAAGRALTGLLAARIAAGYEAQPLPAALVPVPLHPARLGQRGFNQALLVARWLRRRWQLPVLDRALREVSARTPQKSLDAARRRRNRRDAYRSSGCYPAHVALVDDVVTTGATAEALAALLRQHGAQRVDLWCLARTPPPGSWPTSARAGT